LKQRGTGTLLFGGGGESWARTIRKKASLHQNLSRLGSFQHGSGRDGELEKAGVAREQQKKREAAVTHKQLNWRRPYEWCP